MLQILILIFAEVLGLYGLIVALILNTKSGVTAYEVCQHSCLESDQTDEWRTVPYPIELDPDLAQRIQHRLDPIHLQSHK